LNSKLERHLQKISSDRGVSIVAKRPIEDVKAAVGELQDGNKMLKLLIFLNVVGQLYQTDGLAKNSDNVRRIFSAEARAMKKHPGSSNKAISNYKAFIDHRTGSSCTD